MDSGGASIPVVPILNYLVEVFDFILTQSGIGLDSQPFGGIDATLQLYAHTIRILDVGCERFANVADLARLHELVGVVHIIEVGTRLPDVAGIVITQFIVKESLGFREWIGTVVGEVVALGLTVTHRY